MSTATPTPLNEGKTKIILPNDKDRTHVLIRSKDDITAGDGERHDILEGKAIAATTTTCNVFRLIQKDGVVPTHYHSQVDEVTFDAIKATMLPIEVVVRRIGYGSYLKRQGVNPTEHKRGIKLDKPEIEFFYKDDANHDPIMIRRLDEGTFDLHDAKKPVSAETKVGEIAFDRVSPKFGLRDNDVTLMRVAAMHVFELLERAWLNNNFTLVDLKVEFGFDPYGRLMLADVVDNDSWRIWRCGDPTDALDKQVYRDLLADVDPATKAEALKKILENYQLVAKLTEKF